MGTSSSTPGPKGPRWGSAKGAATRLAKGTAGAEPRKVVRQAALALYGDAGTWSAGSTRTAQRLAGLLGGAVRDGVIETARQFAIGDLEGRVTGDAIMEILDWVAGDAVDLDDQAAKRSAEAVLSDLVRDGIDLDQQLDPHTGTALFRSFLVQYLTRSIITPLASRLTEDVSARQAREHERSITRVVEALVQSVVSQQQLLDTDWLGPEGGEVFERIRNDALEILAGGNT